jgi:hypothetical protein
MGPPSDELTVSISKAASDVLETPIEELPPLSDAIDPDALDAFVGSVSSTRGEPDLSITFSYNNYDVTVTGTGSISLTKAEQ